MKPRTEELASPAESRSKLPDLIKLIAELDDYDGRMWSWAGDGGLLALNEALRLLTVRRPPDRVVPS